MKRPGVRIVRESYTPPPHVEHLRYTLDVFDDRGNLVEVLGRLADLAVAIVAFDAAVAMYPDKRVFLRERARVIGRVTPGKPQTEHIESASPQELT